MLYEEDEVAVNKEIDAKQFEINKARTEANNVEEQVDSLQKNYSRNKAEQLLELQQSTFTSILARLNKARKEASEYGEDLTGLDSCISEMTLKQQELKRKTNITIEVTEATLSAEIIAAVTDSETKAKEAATEAKRVAGKCKEILSYQPITHSSMPSKINALKIDYKNQLIASTTNTSIRKDITSEYDRLNALEAEAKRLIFSAKLLGINHEINQANKSKQALVQELAELEKLLADNSAEIGLLENKINEVNSELESDRPRILRELANLADSLKKLKEQAKDLLARKENKQQELTSVEAKLDVSYLYNQIGLKQLERELQHFGIEANEFKLLIAVAEKRAKRQSLIQKASRILKSGCNSSKGFLCLYNLHTEESEKLITTGRCSGKTRIAKQQAEKVMDKMSDDFKQRCLDNNDAHTMDAVVTMFAYAIQHSHDEAEFIAKVNQLSKP